MQAIIVLIFKAVKKLFHILRQPFDRLFTNIILYCNNVKHGKFTTKGIPYITVARGGKLTIGNNIFINNTTASNPVGHTQRCIFAVDTHGELVIGNNVGLSFTVINCQKKIVIKDNVVIGAGTSIYDSDYHPINAAMRAAGDTESIGRAEVLIENNVFIGANCIILKGVKIAENSVIGAGSVVTKNIPPNEIWAGNPAKFLKALV